MKKIIFALLFILSSLSFAGDMTGVGARALLNGHNIDLDQLTRSGHQLLLGDLTGVGKTIELEKIKIYLTKKDVVVNNQINFIKTTNNDKFFPLVDNHGEYKFQDILDIKLPSKVIKKQAIEAVIIAP